MTEAGDPGGPLDVPTLRLLGRSAATHRLVTGWALLPDGVSPRRLRLPIDAGRYPATVEAVRIDLRWYVGGEYTIHYLESGGDRRWECRWDHHPKPGAPTAHQHPPPAAGADVIPSSLDEDHPLGVLFGVLEWVADRVATLHTD